MSDEFLRRAVIAVYVIAIPLIVWDVVLLYGYHVMSRPLQLAIAVVMLAFIVVMLARSRRRKALR